MADRGGGRSPFVAILAVVLVLVGLAFLFQNFGLLRWGLWGTLWRFWPVLLTVLGIYLLIGRSRPGLAAALSLVAVAAAFALSWASGGPSGSGPDSRGSFSETLGSLQRAQVTMEFGAGELTLDSLPATSPELVAGEFQHRGVDQAIEKKFQTQDGIGRLELSSPLAMGRFLGDFRQSWQVRLTPRIPLELNIKAGASRGELNLTNLLLSHLRLDIGASQATISLPQAPLGLLEAVVKAGAANLTIVVPEGVAARIRPQAGLASLKLDEKRFPRAGEFYASPGFAQASNRIELQIEGGLARIEIK